MEMKSLSALWQRQCLDSYLKIMVKFITCKIQQRKAAENLKLFCHYFAKLFNYIIENSNMHKDKYNINENNFLNDFNKCRNTIVCQSRKNSQLIQYNSRKLERVIKPLCPNETKLWPFFLFRDSNHGIRNLIHAKKQGKATLTYSKNVWINGVSRRDWLKHFKNHMVIKQQVDFTVNESTTY